MRPTGKVNLVGVAILAALVFAGWYGFTYSPAYMDNLDAEKAVEAGFNAMKSANDNQVRAEVLARLNARTLGWHREEDEAGNLVKKEGLGIKPEQIFIERDDVNNTATVRVTYIREIERWPLEGSVTKEYTVEKVGPYK